MIVKRMLFFPDSILDELVGTCRTSLAALRSLVEHLCFVRLAFAVRSSSYLHCWRPHRRVSRSGSGSILCISLSSACSLLDANYCTTSSLRFRPFDRTPGTGTNEERRTLYLDITSVKNCSCKRGGKKPVEFYMKSRGDWSIDCAQWCTLIDWDLVCVVGMSRTC
jgi:hypothetical protein